MPGTVVIRDDVPCAALFRAGTITPRAFKWDNGWLTVTAISRYWQGYHRSHTLHFWQVKAGSRSFKACYQQGELYWMVEELGATGKGE